MMFAFIVLSVVHLAKYSCVLLRTVLRQLGVIVITLMHLVVARPTRCNHSIAAISSTVRALDDNETLSRWFHAIMIACCTCTHTIDGCARVINRSMRKRRLTIPFFSKHLTARSRRRIILGRIWYIMCTM